MGSDLLSKEEKERILRTLEVDAEFRYAVAGLIGLSEILRRLDRHEEQLVKIWERLAKIDEEIAKLREDMIKGFERHDKEFEKVWNEIARLREEMVKEIERHDKEIEKVWSEIAKLREDMLKGFERHDAELAKLREDMVKGFERYDQLIAKLREDMIKGFERHDQQIAKLREDMLKGFERHDREIAALREEQKKIWEEIARLREDMVKGFERLDRRISALGARWGVESEEAFREGLRGILEKELGFRVEKWEIHDDKGVVFGYPSIVEVDVVVADGKVILIEISSHVRASDVYAFKRKAELYKEKTGREPDRLIMVTPYADEKAFEAAVRLGVEIYTNV